MLLHFPLILMDRLNQTESAIFSFCWFTLFPENQFFSIFRRGVAVNSYTKYQILCTKIINVSEFGILVV